MRNDDEEEARRAKALALLAIMDRNARQVGMPPLAGKRDIAEPIVVSSAGPALGASEVLANPPTFQEQKGGPMRLDEHTRQYLDRELELCGNVSTQEALDISARYHVSHFRDRLPGGERARYSIPADPKRDDDMRLAAFIARAERAFRLVQRMHRYQSAPLDFAEHDAIEAEIAALGLKAD